MPNILSDKRGEIACITLNWPGKRQAGPEARDRWTAGDR
jgi:hypothetical protein